MLIIEFYQYFSMNHLILDRSLLMLTPMVLGLMMFSCESRFGNTPIYESQRASETLGESVVVTKKNVEQFDRDELIQYLKFHEEAGWIHISEKEIEECLKGFEQDFQLLELVSDFYLNREDLDQALFYNTEAEQRGASSTDFYKKRAAIYLALEQFGLAIDYINKAVKINGNDPDIYLSKGQIYMKLGDSISALKYIEQAFGNDSSRLDVARDLAFLYTSTKQLDRARFFANWLVDNGSYAGDMKYLLVELNRNENKHFEANQILSDMLDTGDIKAGETLVDHFEQESLFDSMLYYATRVLDHDTLNMRALEAKAIAFDHKGYFSSALMYYNQMLDADSLNKEAIEGIGKVNRKIAYLRKLREQREAIPTFDFASPRKETN